MANILLTTDALNIDDVNAKTTKQLKDVMRVFLTLSVQLGDIECMPEHYPGSHSLDCEG